MASIILTVIFYMSNLARSLKKVKKEISKIIINKLNENNSSKFQQLKKIAKKNARDVLTSLIIDNWNKLFVLVFLFLFSIDVVLAYVDYKPGNIGIILLGILAICIFIGIGIFIERPIGKYYNKEAYFLKLLIVLMYPIVMFRSLLDNFNTIGLLFTVVISVGYTFALIKNSIDTFSSLLFQYLNFFLVLIFLNLLIIGLSFGLYYFNHNDTFHFFSDNEKQIIDINGLKYIFYVAYVGISPFFSFPGDIKISNDIINFIPIIEYIFGYIFNLSIVGFFISYSISKYFERRSVKIK